MALSKDQIKALEEERCALLQEKHRFIFENRSELESDVLLGHIDKQIWLTPKLKEDQDKLSAMILHIRVLEDKLLAPC